MKTNLNFINEKRLYQLDARRYNTIPLLKEMMLATLLVFSFCLFIDWINK
ncbi:MAG: hypothetical protein J0M08_00685 [Bacteroidetes bacterium]|nr:hypothetical protein [Bacteroidota bacterium]